MNKVILNEKGFSQGRLRELGEALEEHTWENRAEVEASDICMCTACYYRFPPSAVSIWQDGKSAVCPNPACNLAGAVIGSLSGLNFEDYDYS